MTPYSTPNISVRTIQARIKKGVALLDSTLPNWGDMVDPVTFNIGHAGNCLVGQITSKLYGSKFEAMRVLDHMSIFNRSPIKAWNEQLGFNHARLDSIPQNRNPRERSVCQIMNACWKYHIKQRQTPEHRLKLVEKFLDNTQAK